MEAMAREEPDWLVVGHVSKAHGTAGELYVTPLTDHPGDVYAPGVVVRLADADGRAPDPDLPPLRVEEGRPFKKGWLVAFGGVADRHTAERFRGRYLVVERSTLPELAEGELFYHQLLGMEVFAPDGSRIGEITEVYEMSPADLLEIRGPGGTVLVPFLEAIVREVDAAGRRMVIDPPEGLLG